MGGEQCQFAGGALVVVLLPIPQRDVVPLDGGEPGFEGQNPLGLAARVRLTEAAQHGGDMLLVLLAQGLTLGILLEVVVPIRAAPVPPDRGRPHSGRGTWHRRRSRCRTARRRPCGPTGQRRGPAQPDHRSGRYRPALVPAGVSPLASRPSLIQIAGVEIADLLGQACRLRTPAWPAPRPAPAHRRGICPAACRRRHRRGDRRGSWRWRAICH